MPLTTSRFTYIEELLDFARQAVEIINLHSIVKKQPRGQSDPIIKISIWIFFEA